MIFKTKAKLIKNVEVVKNYYKMLLYCPRVAKAAGPGQFIQVKVSERDEPLLRRPLSIHRVEGAYVEFLYQAVGMGTRALSHRKSAEFVDIIGPLGSGFSCQSLTANNHAPVLVGGGMGVAPLVCLAQKLARSRPLVLIGGRTKEHILCERDFKKYGCEVKVATDDGSKGFKGKVTDLLLDLLRRDTQYAEGGMIYACGPKLMLKAISGISKQRNIPAQVSLEEHMACGIGACLGCVVSTKSGQKRACKEGPVFNANEVNW
jgi:dihydroorotate dehydrogenase electron transfer subunit